VSDTADSGAVSGRTSDFYFLLGSCDAVLGRAAVLLAVQHSALGGLPKASVSLAGESECFYVLPGE
jgi:hypothetical protein